MDSNSREQRVRRDRRRRDGNRRPPDFDDSHLRKSKSDHETKGSNVTEINNKSTKKEIDYTAIPDPHMFDNLKRETDEIAAITAKKPVKRQVFSTWTKYEAPPEEDKAKTTDFQLMLEGSSLGSQFKFKSEKKWTKQDLSKYSAKFYPNKALISRGMKCFSLCDKLELPRDIFTLQQLEKMDSKSSLERKERIKYSHSVLKQNVRIISEENMKSKGNEVLYEDMPTGSLANDVDVDYRHEINVKPKILFNENQMYVPEELSVERNPIELELSSRDNTALSETASIVEPSDIVSTVAKMEECRDFKTEDTDVLNNTQVDLDSIQKENISVKIDLPVTKIEPSTKAELGSQLTDKDNELSMKISKEHKTKSHKKRGSKSMKKKPSPEPEREKPNPEPARQKPSPDPEKKSRDPEQQRIKCTPEPERIKQSPEPERIKQGPEPERIKQSPETERIKHSPETERVRQSPETGRIKQSPEPERIKQSPDPERIGPGLVSENKSSSGHGKEKLSSELGKYVTNPYPKRDSVDLEPKKDKSGPVVESGKTSLFSENNKKSPEPERNKKSPEPEKTRSSEPEKTKSNHKHEKSKPHPISEKKKTSPEVEKSMFPKYEKKSPSPKPENIKSESEKVVVENETEIGTKEIVKESEELTSLDFLLNLTKPANEPISKRPITLVNPNIEEDDNIGTPLSSMEKKTEDLEDWLDGILDD